MWAAVISFTILFSIAVWIVPGMTSEIWWKVLVAGAISAVLCVGVFDSLIRRDVRRRSLEVMP